MARPLIDQKRGMKDSAVVMGHQVFEMEQPKQPLLRQTFQRSAFRNGKNDFHPAPIQSKPHLPLPDLARARQIASPVFRKSIFLLIQTGKTLFPQRRLFWEGFFSFQSKTNQNGNRCPQTERGSKCGKRHRWLQLHRLGAG